MITVIKLSMAAALYISVMASIAYTQASTTRDADVIVRCVDAITRDADVIVRCVDASTHVTLM